MSKNTKSKLLFQLVQENDLKKVKQLSNKKKHLVNVKYNNETLLHLASEKGYHSIVSLLLSRDAIIDATNDHGSTPLHNACMYNQYETVKILLENEADPNIKCNLGNTALHNAARNGNVNIVEALMHCDININEQNIDGWTALHRGVSSNHLEVTKCLLEGNADPAIKSNNGKTAYEVSLSMMYYNIANVLLKYEPGVEVVSTSSSSTDGFYTTSLHLLTSVKNTFGAISLKRHANAISYQVTQNSHKNDNIKAADKNTSIFKKAHETLKTKINKESKKAERKEVEGTINEDGFNEEHECPVCFEIPLSPVHIYQCHNGHIYCANCKNMPNMYKCPQCGVSIEGLENRNRYAEENIAKINSRKKK